MDGFEEESVDLERLFLFEHMDVIGKGNITTAEYGKQEVVFLGIKIRSASDTKEPIEFMMAMPSRDYDGIFKGIPKSSEL